MAQEFSVVTKPVVSLFVTSNINSFTSERRFQKGDTISDLKNKLELLTGASATSVKLELYDKNNRLVTPISDDGALIGSFPIEDGMRLHVIDPTHKVGEFEDTSKVEKFELPEGEYQKRQDTARNFLMRNKLGKYAEVNPEEEEKKRKAEEEEEAIAKSILVGSRCEVRVPKQMERRATVMYVGKVHFKPGWWIGVKYDEPLGKNDGSVGEKRYFECRPNYGSFVVPQHVVVGDFPEEDFEMGDDEI